MNTGQCCKPGGNCTICPTNYILTAEGCEYCGECVGRLLTSITDLDSNVTLALKSLKQGTAGIIAELQYQDVNKTLQRYGIILDLALIIILLVSFFFIAVNQGTIYMKIFALIDFFTCISYFCVFY